jgi:hypothetical protein
MKGSIFWNITPCCPLKVDRHFRGTRRLHRQGGRISQARNQYEANSKQSYPLQYLKGRAIAVSRWLPTAGARVRARSGHVGFVVGKVALGQVFP